MLLGNQLREARKERGLTQAELGAKLDVKAQQISDWECGQGMSKQTQRMIKNFINNGVQAFMEENTTINVSGGTQANIPAMEVEIKYLKKIIEEKDELIREIRSKREGLD